MNADELQRGGMASFDSEDVVDDAEDAAGRALSGIQTNSLISIMNAYTAGNMSEGQAAQLIATAVGISTKQALNILRGNVEEESVAENLEADVEEDLDVFEEEEDLEEGAEEEIEEEAVDLKSIIEMLRALMEEL
jgi:hypothetical protein